VAGPLPRYLYDRNPFNDLPYLLSADVLGKSWRIVRGDTSERFTSDPNAAWYWGNVVRFGREQVLRGLDLTKLNARYQQPQRSLEGMRASFEHNLLPLLVAHPDTEFDLVWPPYSILVWLDFAQRDQVDLTLRFKRYVAEVAARLPNVQLIDLQAERAVTHDLERYDDIYHFDPAVNEWLVEAACRGHDRVDAGSVETFERELRGQVQAIATAEGLAQVVGRRPAP
jgi:hypothetical protein